MRSEETSVLVVGGSLVGLSTALFLAWQNVPVMLVERHKGSSLHPRAIGYTGRTMELMRAIGLDSSIPAAPADFRLIRAQVESLAGKWIGQTSWSPQSTDGNQIEYSPVRAAAIAQDRFEPMLRDKARQFGADIRVNTQFIAFNQDADGVSAVLRRREDGSEYTVRASYLVACDGADSSIRETLGIPRRGRGHIRTVRSVLFKSPLEEYLAKGVTQFEIQQNDLRAFLTTYNDGRWVLMFTDDVERNEEELKKLIIKAIGRCDLPMEIVTTGRWELGAHVAESYTAGRVFLAGDAAHALPPTRGGYGANTGIQDAHNLAWKLAAVLAGQSSPLLLETYDPERRSVAWVRHQQTFARQDYQKDADGRVVIDPILDDDAMEFGQIYRSTAVLGAGTDLPAARRPDEWSGQPGTRAPHLWLSRGGQQISTLDLFHKDWVLLAEAKQWQAAATQAFERTGMEIVCPKIGAEIVVADIAEFRRSFGLNADGASLIRPDGYIAWRSVDLPEAPAEVLTKVMAMVSFSLKHS